MSKHQKARIAYLTEMIPYWRSMFYLDLVWKAQDEIEVIQNGREVAPSQVREVP